jgi:hydroxycarboxylate dehydrogenase B
VQAVQLGIDKARAAGVSVVALRHAGHLGRIGDWAEMAVDAGLVSIHFVNVAGGQLVAPFGAIDRRMATNPVCIGVPVADGPPVVLDFATSLVAEGKVQVALEGGAPLPPGALIGDDGRFSDDPHVLYGETPPGRSPNPRKGSGAMVAMGLHKGSGLSMLCELLAGALTGSGTAGPGNERFANGMLSIYIDPAVLDVDDRIAADVTAYLGWFVAARPAGPGGEVLSPGEPERRKKADRLANGLTIPDDTWEAILNAADLSGLGRARVQELLGTA